MQGCVAVIAHAEGSVAVDAGSCPTVAAAVQSVIATAGLPAVRARRRSDFALVRRLLSDRID